MLYVQHCQCGAALVHTNELDPGEDCDKCGAPVYSAEVPDASLPPGMHAFIIVGDHFAQGIYCNGENVDLYGDSVVHEDEIVRLNPN